MIPPSDLREYKLTPGYFANRPATLLTLSLWQRAGYVCDFLSLASFFLQAIFARGYRKTGFFRRDRGWRSCGKYCASVIVLAPGLENKRIRVLIVARSERIIRSFKDNFQQTPIEPIDEQSAKLPISVFSYLTSNDGRETDNFYLLSD